MASVDKAKQAHERLLQHGLSPVAAAGIVGNIKAESNFDTTVEGKADKTKSIGLGQWNYGRKQGLFDFARKQGRHFSDFNTQIDYIVHELKQPEFAKAYTALQKARTPAEAAIAFMNHYEKPAEWAKKQSVGKRIQAANQALDPNRSFEAAIRKGRDLAQLDLEQWDEDYSTGLEQYAIPQDEETQPQQAEDVVATTQTVNKAPEIDEDEEELDAEVTDAKITLGKAQIEKNFLAELEKQQQPTIQQQQPTQQGIDPSLYQLPTLEIPQFQAPQLEEDFVAMYGGEYEEGGTYDFTNLKNAAKAVGNFLLSQPDSNVENIFEVLDPTGISSWDDIYRSANKTGLNSGETAIEALGAVPFLNKFKSVSKIASSAAKVAALTGRQNKNLNTFTNITKALGNIAPPAGKAVDAFQAYTEFK